MMRAVLRHLINSHQDWQVCSEAKNGGEAVAKAAETHPDVVVLDLAMPIMDGLHAAREILALWPKARVVMFTLYSSEQLEKEASRIGVKRVVSKAGDGGGLLRAIEETLTGKAEDAGQTRHIH